MRAKAHYCAGTASQLIAGVRLTEGQARPIWGRSMTAEQPDVSWGFVGFFAVANGASRLAGWRGETRVYGSGVLTHRPSASEAEQARLANRKRSAPGGVIGFDRQLVEDVAVRLGPALSQGAADGCCGSLPSRVTARTTGTAGVG
jgi:hypothetical protein